MLVMRVTQFCLFFSVAFLVWQYQYDWSNACAAVVRRDVDETQNIMEQLRALKLPDLTVVYAEKLTEGPACTCLLARERIDSDRPLLILNSDQYIDWNEDNDSSGFWKQLAEEKAQGGFAAGRAADGARAA